MNDNEAIVTNTIPAQGRLFVLAAASGTGKTSLVLRLLEEIPSLSFSVSHTTRGVREGEINGKHYHFVDEAAFRQKKAEGDFIESAFVHGNYYGTSHEALQNRLQAGDDLLLEIDWQGARQVKILCPQAVSIFILPPSFEELGKRLNKRGKDSDEVVRERLAKAHFEMAHFDEFDHWLVNDDFESTLQTLKGMMQKPG